MRVCVEKGVGLGGVGAWGMKTSHEPVTRASGSREGGGSGGALEVAGRVRNAGWLLHGRHPTPPPTPPPPRDAPAKLPKRGSTRSMSSERRTGNPLCLVASNTSSTCPTRSICRGQGGTPTDTQSLTRPAPLVSLSGCGGHVGGGREGRVCRWCGRGSFVREAGVVGSGGALTVCTCQG
jgi:hypothetical protein